MKVHLSGQPIMYKKIKEELYENTHSYFLQHKYNNGAI